MTRRVFGKVVGLAAAASSASQAAAATSEPVSIGGRRELFVDHELIGEARYV